jgi:hypothetical protein
MDACERAMDALAFASCRDERQRLPLRFTALDCATVFVTNAWIGRACTRVVCCPRLTTLHMRTQTRRKGHVRVCQDAFETRITSVGSWRRPRCRRQQQSECHRQRVCKPHLTFSLTGLFMKPIALCGSNGPPSSALHTLGRSRPPVTSHARTHPLSFLPCLP